LLSTKPRNLDPRTVVLKEDLPAMKDTAGSSGSLLIKEPSEGLVLRCLMNMQTLFSMLRVLTFRLFVPAGGYLPSHFLKK